MPIALRGFVASWFDFAKLETMTRIVLLLSIALCCLAGCESAPVSDSWHDPAFDGPIRFHRTLVIAMVIDPLVRRPAEDVMVAAIGEGRSIQSYKLLQVTDLTDVDHLVQKLTPNGVDAILTMRLVSTEHEISWVPGSGVYPFDSFWTFYNRAASTARDPENLKSESTVRVQTNLYSVDGGKLLWTGISDSFLAADARDRIEPVVRGIVSRMEAEGILR
jgi:hypothetical protein